ncbi:MOSC domain-containing protein [Paenibacillus sp. GCM10023252]|uniref:MOSC domain-containing protein n=1 Tax=Paenibacillus sp. GCM10023252 TaxID=3252649 RepID=UPI00361DB0F5
MRLSIGQVMELNRYPVKSFRGERLDSCEVESYGLHGDRFCAFYDETKQGWSSYVTASEIPGLLAYEARLVDEEIRITSPEGLAYEWNEELLADMQRHSKKKLSMTSCRAPNMENPDLMSVDVASVLIVTDASLRKLEAIWGKNLDRDRFRANLVIAVDDDALDESSWIGRRLHIGGAELQVDSWCQRCAMITIDPNTMERDPSLLRKVNEQMNLNFGLYASVKRTGRIAAGDLVYLDSDFR